MVEDLVVVRMENREKDMVVVDMETMENMVLVLMEDVDVIEDIVVKKK